MVLSVSQLYQYRRVTCPRTRNCQIAHTLSFLALLSHSKVQEFINLFKDLKRRKNILLDKYFVHYDFNLILFKTFSSLKTLARLIAASWSVLISFGLVVKWSQMNEQKQGIFLTPPLPPFRADMKIGQSDNKRDCKMKNFMEQQLWLAKARFSLRYWKEECPNKNTPWSTLKLNESHCCTEMTLDSRLNHFWKDPLVCVEKTFLKELLGNTN